MCVIVSRGCDTTCRLESATSNVNTCGTEIAEINSPLVAARSTANRLQINTQGAHKN